MENPIPGDISQDDGIVVVVGLAGSGKSTFIEIATGQDLETVNHDLRSSASTRVRAVRCIHPIDCRPVVFVDTPGFDDTYRTDTEILTVIANWLENVCKHDINIATIIYLQRISDNRVTRTLLRNLKVFACLCGQDALPNVTIATTMWGDVRRMDIAVHREEELKREYWKDLLDRGCRAKRFNDTYESAWDIVGRLPDKKSRVTLALPSEIARGKLLSETAAGIENHEEQTTVSKGLKGIFRRFFSRLRH